MLCSSALAARCAVTFACGTLVLSVVVQSAWTALDSEIAVSLAWRERASASDLGNPLGQASAAGADSWSWTCDAVDPWGNPFRGVAGGREWVSSTSRPRLYSWKLGRDSLVWSRAYSVGPNQRDESGHGDDVLVLDQDEHKMRAFAYAADFMRLLGGIVLAGALLASHLRRRYSVRALKASHMARTASLALLLAVVTNRVGTVLGLFPFPIPTPVTFVFGPAVAQTLSLAAVYLPALLWISVTQQGTIAEGRDSSLAPQRRTHEASQNDGAPPTGTTERVSPS